MPPRNKNNGLPAGKWETLFKKAGVEAERLEVAKSEKARTTILGNFLAQNVDREVPVEINGRTGKATLRMNVGRAKTKLYFFEITWDEPENKKPDKPKGESRNESKAVGQDKVSSPQSPQTNGKPSAKSGAKATSTPKRLSEVRGNNESWA